MKTRPKNPLRRLDLGDWFTFQELTDQVETLTQRRLVFRPWQMPPAISGAWLRSPTTDHVFYPQDAGPGHQRHCQLHELGHILAGHRPVSADVNLIAIALGQARPAGEVAQALYRHRYTSQEEREAEELATRLEIRLVAGPAQVFDDEVLDRHVQVCLARQDL